MVSWQQEAFRHAGRVFEKRCSNWSRRGSRCSTRMSPAWKPRIVSSASPIVISHVFKRQVAYKDHFGACITPRMADETATTVVIIFISVPNGVHWPVAFGDRIRNCWRCFVGMSSIILTSSPPSSAIQFQSHLQRTWRQGAEACARWFPCGFPAAEYLKYKILLCR